MNVDEAMKRANNYRDSKNRWKNLKYEISTSELVAISLAAEVERLRDENEWMGIAGQQMARHLAEAKAELAAAKAASVCPVKVISTYGMNGDTQAAHEGDTIVEIYNNKEGVIFRNWLRDRMKDTTPPTT